MSSNPLFPNSLGSALSNTNVGLHCIYAPESNLIVIIFPSVEITLAGVNIGSLFSKSYQHRAFGITHDKSI